LPPIDLTSFWIVAFREVPPSAIRPLAPSIVYETFHRYRGHGGLFCRDSRRDGCFFALVGVLGWGSCLAFYRALAIGPISIASPIVSGYAAVTVVLAVIVLGESFSGCLVS
jgi:uncharacterized membrane protein